MRKTGIVIVAIAINALCAGLAFGARTAVPEIRMNWEIPQPTPKYNFEALTKQWTDYGFKSAIGGTHGYCCSCQGVMILGWPEAPYFGTYTDHKWVQNLLELWGGDENFANVVTPDRIELIKIAFGKNGYDETTIFSDHISGQLAPADAALLQFWLSTDSSLDWWEKPSEYDLDLDAFLLSPGIYAYRAKFWRNGNAVCVDLDFVNRQLQVLVDGKVIGRTGLGNGYEYLKQVVEYYFPELLWRIGITADST